MPSGWHSRGYLPHVDHPHLCQSITFRLADALPERVVSGWTDELRSTADADRQRLLRHRIDRYEDAGYGSCWLREPACASIVAGLICAGDGAAYRLHAWVVMPNHVHVLIGPHPGVQASASPERPDLSQILRRWKGASAHAINRHLGRRGALWQPESFDRWIRDEGHFQAVADYIRGNPSKAGLDPWPWVG